MYLTLPNLELFFYVLISDELQNSIHNLYVVLNWLLIFPPHIFIKHFIIFGGVYNFMFYMIGLRLNNWHINSFYAYTYACYLHFCLQCCRTLSCFSWSLVDVLTRVESVITKTNIFTLSLFVSAIKCLTWILIL